MHTQCRLSRFCNKTYICNVRKPESKRSELLIFFLDNFHHKKSLFCFANDAFYLIVYPSVCCYSLFCHRRETTFTVRLFVCSYVRLFLCVSVVCFSLRVFVCSYVRPIVCSSVFCSSVRLCWIKP